MSANQNQPMIASHVWTTYWTNHPMMEIWQMQTFARMNCVNFQETLFSHVPKNQNQNQTNNNLKTNNSCCWAPELKAHLNSCIENETAKKVRSFFQNNNKIKKASSNTSKSAVEIIASPEATTEDAFDVFVTLCRDSSTQNSTNQQPILDFSFSKIQQQQQQFFGNQNQQSEESSSSASSSSLNITFCSEFSAERVVAQLEGAADCKISIPKRLPSSSFELQQNKTTLLLRGVLLSNYLSSFVAEDSENSSEEKQEEDGSSSSCQLFTQLFEAFGPCCVVKKSGNNSSLKISFVERKKESHQVADSKLIENVPFMLLPRRTTDDDNSTTTEKEKEEEENNKKEQQQIPLSVLHTMASPQECALNALLNLQRPLAEDWGLMLTYSFF